jgi:hypothetical protein
MKLCVYCNTVKPLNEISNGGKSKKCKECYNKIQHNKNHNLKYELIKYGGGECIRCKNNSLPTLHFHHLNPKNKSFTIGDYYHGARKKTLTLKELKNEIDKCVILCANCHCEFHSKLFNINESREIVAIF